jgi:hypothetical protein
VSCFSEWAPAGVVKRRAECANRSGRLVEYLGPEDGELAIVATAANAPAPPDAATTTARLSPTIDGLALQCLTAQRQHTENTLAHASGAALYEWTFRVLRCPTRTFAEPAIACLRGPVRAAFEVFRQRVLRTVVECRAAGAPNQKKRGRQETDVTRQTHRSAVIGLLCVWEPEPQSQVPDGRRPPARGRRKPDLTGVGGGRLQPAFQGPPKSDATLRRFLKSRNRGGDRDQTC